MLNGYDVVIAHTCNLCHGTLASCDCGAGFHLAQGERHTKCPQCAIWHWRERSMFCSNACSQKSSKMRKRGDGRVRL